MVLGRVELGGDVVVDGLNCTAGAELVVVVRLVGLAAITAAGVSRGAVANVLREELLADGLAGEASTIRIGASFAGPLALRGLRAGVATAGLVVGAFVGALVERVVGISVRIVPSGSVTVGGAIDAGDGAAGEAPGSVGVAAGG